jgi:parvulin-like peptidyl-prolyl isomerase
MAKLIKQPLLHFLVAGILIFAGYQWSAPAVSDIENLEKVIPVDRLALLNFMQFRAQAFQPELFSEQLDAMSESDLEKLIDDFVREEALYREALALGMDQGDYIIRQRLVQKVEFLLENMVNQSLVPDDAVIASWFDERRSDYQIDAVYTFTHIFFDAGERGQEQAQQDALSLLNSANIGDIAFNDASQYGDRYPFLQNYVERTRDFVVNNFTEDFVARLDTLAPSDQDWAGPFESRYGFHLVMLRSKTDPYIPAFEEIRERVLDDWRFESVLQNRREAEQQVIDAYEVRLDLQAGQ